MKKLLLMLLMFLLIISMIILVIIPIVSAQSTIKIFNNEFQLVIFIPLALIILALLILVLLYAIEYYKKLTQVKDVINIRNIFSVIFASLKLKKKKEIKSTETNVRKELLILENKLSRLKPEEILKEITLITRNFYKYNLNLKPTSIPTELKTILKKDQSDILEYSEKLSEVKYGGIEVTKEKVKELFNALDALIRKYTLHIIEKQEEPEKVRKKFKKFKKGLLTNAKNNLQIIKSSFSSVKNYFHRLNIKNRKQQILSLIKEGRHMLDNNSPSARNMYIKALLSYYKLRLQEEKEIHSKLQDFHSELDKKGHVKQDLSELSKTIIHLKHSNKQKEGLQFFKKLKDYIKNEEKSNIKKLDRYSEALKDGEQKLTRNIQELEQYAIAKNKKPLLDKLRKIEPKKEIRKIGLKKEIFKIPQTRLTAPPKTKIKLSKHLSNLVQEKNILYHKLKSLEKEAVHYQKESNVYQRQFSQKYIPEEPETKEIPKIVRKYDAHKNIHKLSQERELIERKLTEL